nr:MAG TPA: hypothetical protein [Caudoviricetes sp.]
MNKKYKIVLNTLYNKIIQDINNNVINYNI